MSSADNISVLKKSRRIKLLIFLISVILIVLMFPKGVSIESEVTVGSIWIQEDLIATTSFPIYKDPEVYALEKRKAGEKVFPIFIKNENIFIQSIDSLHSYNTYLITQIENESDESENNNTFISPASFKALKNFYKFENKRSKGNKNLRQVFSLAEDILKRVYKTEILNLLYNEIKKDSIAYRIGKFDYVAPKKKYQDLKVVHDYVAEYVNGAISDPQLNYAIIEYVNHFIRPNLNFDEKLTQLEIAQAYNKVSPNTGIVNENERIIAKHDRVTDDKKLKIDSYRKAKAEEGGFVNTFTQTLGKFLHVFLIISLYAIYLFLFRKKIFHDNVKILLISLIILFISSITFLINQIVISSPLHLLVILPAASMLLTIIFDSRVGFYGTVVIALIAGSLRGNDYSFTAMNIFAGALAAYTVRDIKNRTQIFRSFGYILVGYLVSILAFGLERYESYDRILIEYAFAAGNALISPVFTFGMIIFFEKFFKITTDLTLLELTDFNRPLIKNLARVAPGTFTHSMTVGSLVERAAEAIGANPLLARVGAYYHDVGKTVNSDYFVENQMDNENSHSKLDPKASAAIIINHVTKGIDLAKEEKLPAEIIDFIPMHHGTLVMSFFYEKAKELYGDSNVNIIDYRYKGPKPNSKETALVMLADACESTVRSIDEPDPAKVENVINSLFKNRLADGQLDESPVTLKDLKIIKEIFLNILLVQHHKRIRYPKQDEMENLKEKSDDIS
ncbi:MAG: HDIG domain-containing protein [Ignavibacteriales bacterium]|nr:HDIG domain-containing protein [Ignavibacteriales bacterium]